MCKAHRCEKEGRTPHCHANTSICELHACPGYCLICCLPCLTTIMPAIKVIQTLPGSVTTLVFTGVHECSHLYFSAHLLDIERMCPARALTVCQQTKRHSVKQDSTICFSQFLSIRHIRRGSGSACSMDPHCETESIVQNYSLKGNPPEKAEKSCCCCNSQVQQAIFISL